MVFAAMLLERGLGSPAITTPFYSEKRAQDIRIIAASLASLSILADTVSIYWFWRMKRRFRHTLIITLLIADLLKDINYVAFTGVSFHRGPPDSGSGYCQAMGFFNEFLVEITG